ncbi:MAG: hypothetical protein L6R42_007677 [Xanthoria sp. 1 TBL-2021]|nr:MAG: hypothetical protein L6R42_007677 [Xanthoria sp. 1 TBL-2021]
MNHLERLSEVYHASRSGFLPRSLCFHSAPIHQKHTATLPILTISDVDEQIMSPPSSSVVGLPLPAEDCIVRDTTKVFAWFRPSNQPAKDAFHSVMESLISLGTAGAHCLKFMHATREAPRAVSVDSIDENLVEDEARVKPNKTWVGGYGLELENASLESSGWTVGAGCRGRQERKVDLLLTTETEQTSITSRHASLQFHPQSHQLRLMAHHTVSISGSGGYKRFKGEHRILRHDDMVELGSCTYRIEFALYETSAAYKEELRIFMADRVLGSTKLHPGLLAASNRQMMTIDNYTFLAGAFADGSFGDVSAGTDDKGDLVAVKRLKKAKKEKIEGHKALMNKIGFHVGSPLFAGCQKLI